MRRSIKRIAGSLAAAAVLLLVPAPPAGAAALPAVTVQQTFICWEIQGPQPPPNGLSARGSTGRAAQATGTPCKVRLKLSIKIDHAVTVVFATRQGSAVPKLDYTEVADGIAVIPAGETEGYATVEILSDQLREQDEYFVLGLVKADGAEIGKPSAGTIIIKDPPDQQ